MKLLSGVELAGFIKERQAHQVRALKQANNIQPKLAIIVCNDDPVINKYVNLKKQYGKDILVDVEVFQIDQNQAISQIKKLNKDKSFQGIIAQLPLKNSDTTDEIINTIDNKKDVDGLVKNSKFDSATPMAIFWLLAGFNIELAGKNIVLVGHGRLVGAPLKRMLINCNLNPQIIDIDTKNPQAIMQLADILITAVGRPNFITSTMIPLNCVVIDAATTTDDSQIKGDLADDVYDREDLILTPKKGGVGPLTVCALFDNLIRACQDVN